MFRKDYVMKRKFLKCFGETFILDKYKLTFKNIVFLLNLGGFYKPDGMNKNKLKSG